MKGSLMVRKRLSDNRHLGETGISLITAEESSFRCVPHAAKFYHGLGSKGAEPVTV